MVSSSILKTSSCNISYILSKPLNLSSKFKNNIIILVHGLTSSKNSSTNKALELKLNNLGFTTIRFDLFAHGDSSGSFEDLSISKTSQNILDIYNYVQSLGYFKIGLVGSSFGGYSSLIAASMLPSLSCLILKSPVSDYYQKDLFVKGKKFMSDFKQKGSIIYSSVHGIDYNLNYNFVLDYLKSEHNGYLVAPNINIPTLILHGTADSIVPYSQSLKLSSLIKYSKLILVEGGNHRLSYSGDKLFVINSISNFIKLTFS